MVLEILGAASLAIWLYLLVGRGGFWRMRVAGPMADAAAPAPSVVAVVPARDEAPVVGRAIASLAAQRYDGGFAIVLVDDHSSDGTADAARAAASAASLTVIPAAALPPGWTGKLWAVAEGVRYASRLNPDYILLTDADIVHAPGNLRGLVARAEREGFDLVSYMVRLACRTPAERMLIPAFVFFFFLLYPPAWTSNPRRRTAGAAGGCMLIRRAMLERLGGVESIRGSLIDDCALAAAAKRHGGRVWLGLSAETESIREYATLGEVGRMISRSAFTQLRYSTWLLAGTVAGLVVTYLAPPAAALTCGWPGALPGAVAWLLMSACYVPILRFYRRSSMAAPALPLVATFYLAATVHSAAAWWCGKGGRWKGRTQAVSGRGGVSSGG